MTWLWVAFCFVLFALACAVAFLLTAWLEYLDGRLDESSTISLVDKGQDEPSPTVSSVDNGVRL